MLSKLKYKHLMVWEKGIGCFFVAIGKVILQIKTLSV